VQDFLARTYLRRFTDFKRRTRAVRETDLPRVLDIYRTSFDGGSEAILERLAFQFRSVFYVIEGPDGAVAGYAAYYLRVYLAAFRPFIEATLFSIAVDSSFRGKGLGNVLLEESVEELRRNGVDKVHLFVNVENDRAILLYLKHGFVVAGTVPDICGHGAMCHRMDLDLGR
jgi:ribosomal protein S18 acetylase RimI-like enzyme